jgi:hypothetical protein
MKPFGWYGFLSGFPPFAAFLISVAMEKVCITSNKRKNNATFKGKRRDNVNKSKPPPLAAVYIAV